MFLLALLSALPLYLTALLEWLPVLSLIGTLWGGYKAWRAVRKEKEDFLVIQATQKAEDKAGLEARVKDYTLFKEDTKDRMLGFSVALEKVADRASTDCSNLETKITNLQVLSREVSNLQITTEGTNSRVEKLESSLERLEDRLNTKLDKLGEKHDAANQWQNTVLNEILLNLNGGSKRLSNNL